MFYFNSTFSFLLAPLLVGLFTYGLYSILFRTVKNEKHLKLVRLLGQNSFYVYLTHTSIVWPIARIAKYVLERIGLKNTSLEMIILTIPCAALVVLLSWVLNKIVKAEKQLMRVE